MEVIRGRTALFDCVHLHLCQDGSGYVGQEAASAQSDEDQDHRDHCPAAGLLLGGRKLSLLLLAPLLTNLPLLLSAPRRLRRRLRWRLGLGLRGPAWHWTRTKIAKLGVTRIAISASGTNSFIGHDLSFSAYKEQDCESREGYVYHEPQDQETKITRTVRGIATISSRIKLYPH